LESKGGAIAMITTIVPSDSLALKILMMHSLKNYSLLAQANIPLLSFTNIKKQQSKQRYKCYLGDPALMLAILSPK
jgi:hypothetical protein